MEPHCLAAYAAASALGSWSPWRKLTALWACECSLEDRPLVVSQDLKPRADVGGVVPEPRAAVRDPRKGRQNPTPLPVLPERSLRRPRLSARNREPAGWRVVSNAWLHALARVA